MPVANSFNCTNLRTAAGYCAIEQHFELKEGPIEGFRKELRMSKNERERKSMPRLRDFALRGIIACGLAAVMSLTLLRFNHLGQVFLFRKKPEHHGCWILSVNDADGGNLN